VAFTMVPMVPPQEPWRSLPELYSPNHLEGRKKVGVLGSLRIAPALLLLFYVRFLISLTAYSHASGLCWASVRVGEEVFEEVLCIGITRRPGASRTCPPL
jgi:hypothetical protein